MGGWRRRKDSVQDEIWECHPRPCWQSGVCLSLSLCSRFDLIGFQLQEISASGFSQEENPPTPTPGGQKTHVCDFLPDDVLNSNWVFRTKLNRSNLDVKFFYRVWIDQIEHEFGMGRGMLSCVGAQSRLMLRGNSLPNYKPENPNPWKKYTRTTQSIKP